MEINPDVKQKIQIALALAIAVAAVRTAYVLYERHAEGKQETQPAAAAPPLNPDYYVVPKKLYPYDLKSARELTKQPVWVKVVRRGMGLGDRNWIAARAWSRVLWPG